MRLILPGMTVLAQGSTPPPEQAPKAPEAVAAEKSLSPTVEAKLTSPANNLSPSTNFGSASISESGLNLSPETSTQAEGQGSRAIVGNNFSICFGGQFPLRKTLRGQEQVIAATSDLIIAPVNRNDAPVITTSEVTSVNEDASYSYTFAASDVDVGDSVTLSATTIPSWLSF